jgi:hypothetical protein
VSPLDEPRAFVPGEVVFVEGIGKPTLAACTVVRVGTCDGADCGEPLVWVRTPADKLLPCDPGVGEEAGMLAQPLEPHWGSCPNAEDFRKASPGRKPGVGGRGTTEG